MRRTLAIVAIALGVMLFPVSPAAPAVHETVASMTLREKAGQLVMFGVTGTHLSAAERDLIKRHHLGGVILFRHNYRDRSQLGALTGQIQRAARRSTPHGIGALISVDQEGGVVKRFSDMPPWYSAPELGARGDSALAYDQGRRTARALRSVGVNVNLAPVADLDIGPNHVMRSRSFGSHPRRVGRMARSFAKGLQSRRTAAAVKHFPGFGGADRNSDDGPATIARSKWQLRNVDATPFHKAVAGGARMMMLSHGMYLNDGGRRPASLHPHIATRRLRNEFGFTGVAISDALGAVAWRFRGDISKACRGTIAAGVDIALLVENVYVARACARRIRRAVRNGTIPRSRLDEAVTRVLELKRWVGVFAPS